jgi:hypothetical protein
MKTKLLYFVVLAFIMSMSSCKKNCSSFDDTLLPWITFQQKNILIYTNQFSDSLCFGKVSEYTSSSYTVQKNISEPCHSFSVFTASNLINDENNIYYQIEKVRNNIHITLNFIYPIRYDSIYLYWLETGGHFERDYKKLDESIHPTTINGIEFANAITIEEDTCLYSDNVWKCIIIKGHGIMQFYEKSGVVWTLME